MHTCKLCWYAMFSPKKLVEAQEADNTGRAVLPAGDREHAAFRIHRAFWASAGLVMVTALLGYGAGLLVLHCPWCMASAIARVLQLVGAVLLLWATLFVRGWDIQTFGGTTLSERVNQWLFRGLYIVGTFLLIMSLPL